MVNNHTLWYHCLGVQSYTHYVHMSPHGKKIAVVLNGYDSPCCVYGKLWFAKCSVLHCSLWGVQTINFPYYTQHGMFKRTWATVNGGNGNGNGNRNRKGSSKLQATITLQSSGGEVSLSVVVSNCYLARTVIVT